MSCTEPEPSILRGPADAIAALPHLLGFQPVDSLVGIWVADGAVALTQRIDLDAGADPALVATHLIGTAAPSQASAVIWVLVDEGPGEWDGLLDALRARARLRGIEVLDTLRLCGDRYWSLRCDADCCPPGGRRIEAEVRMRVARAFGAPAPSIDREALVRDLAMDEGAVAAVERNVEELEDDRRSDLDAAVESARCIAIERWRDERIASLMADLTSDPPHSTMPDAGLLPVGLARILTGLVDIRVRDTIVWELSRARHPDVAVARLTAALRAAPPGYAAATASVLALALWQRGDGARAAIALDRALADDGEYRLARLIGDSLGAGLPPGAWQAVIDDLPRARCRMPDGVHGVDGVDGQPAAASV